MIPESDREFAGSVGAAHIRHRDGGRRGGRKKAASRRLALEHGAVLPWVSAWALPTLSQPSIAADGPVSFTP
jgi:hypothetical protein